MLSTDLQAHFHLPPVVCGALREITFEVKQMFEHFLQHFSTKHPSYENVRHECV